MTFETTKVSFTKTGFSSIVYQSWVARMRLSVQLIAFGRTKYLSGICFQCKGNGVLRSFTSRNWSCAFRGPSSMAMLILQSRFEDKRLPTWLSAAITYSAVKRSGALHRLSLFFPPSYFLSWLTLVYYYTCKDEHEAWLTLSRYWKLDLNLGLKQWLVLT